ncbi:RNA polymerase sigma factor SigM [compost metagenome]
MKLPITYREILILYAQYQLSMKEIAPILQLSESAVKSRLFRARARILKLKERELFEQKRQSAGDMLPFK